MRNLKCPRCASVTSVAPSEKPICSHCGLGSSEDAAKQAFGAPTHGHYGTAVNPGTNWGIASIICACVGLAVFGVILGHIGLAKSRNLGMSNGPAIAGLVIGYLFITGAILVGVLLYPPSWLQF